MNNIEVGKYTLESLTTGMFAQMSARTVQTISTMLEETLSLCLLRKLKFVVISYLILKTAAKHF